MGAPASARDDGTPPVTSLDELPRGQDVSDTVIELAGWVVASGDSQGYPFAIMDKAAAQILVFGGDGRLRGAAPGLFGSAVGDHTAPGIAGLALREIPGRDRTTPAGRFVGGYGPSIDAGRVLWVDYESAVSIHPTATGVPEEKRPERLASPSRQGDFLLHLGGIENCRSIARTDIAALLLVGRGVVDLEEEFQERAIAENGRVESHFHRFRMAVMSRIGRITHFTAYVTDPRRNDSPGSAQQILHAPEAAACENCSLCRGRPFAGRRLAHSPFALLRVRHGQASLAGSAA